MWVDSVRPHKGGVSLMRYALNFLVVILAALLSATMFSATTHAADAVWEAGKIVYDERSYLRSGPVSPALADKTGIPEGVEHFVNIDDTEIPPVHSILYFPADTELADATNARHVTFEVTDKGTAGEEYERMGGQQEVSLDQATYESEGEPEVTSCVVSGIGYIICPVMNLMAEGTDKLFNVFKSLLHVVPLSSNTDNGLYRAWSVALSIANVLFVIGFLVVIYSYVTDRGVKQYDIRNILPRVIVAAILINASYYIAAIAVDISNVVGANLQDLFNDIREELVVSDKTVTDPNTWSWNSVTTYVLSGGTIGVGLAAAGAIAINGVGALWLLMPMLVAAVTAMLVVIVVLAARHAIITVLIVLAPIAFAAFILPSTQKYFDRWKSIFMTMLLMYPMFSLLFGGSQLAAYLIAQNATGVTTLLFAMFIQIAPLIITPFLIQFSGSLLSRIAGIVNNPAKGLGDRAKNMAEDRRKQGQARRLKEPNKGWMRTPGLAFAQKMDSRKRNREGRLETNKALRNAQYAMENDAQQQHVALMRAKAKEQEASHINDAYFEASKLANLDHRRETANQRRAENQLRNNKLLAENYLSEIESEKGRRHHMQNGDTVAAGVGAALHAQSLVHATQERRKEMAAQEHRAEVADSMMANPALKAAAAGISGEKGEAIVMAQAIVDKRADFGKGVAAIKEMEKHFRLSGSETEALAMRRGSVTKTDDNGNSYTFDYTNDYAFEAAVDILINEKGSYAQKMALLEQSANPEYAEVRTTIVDGVKKTMLSAAPQLGGQSLDILGTTGIAGPDGADKLTRNYVVKAKMSQEAFANMDADNAKVIFRAIADPVNFDGVDRSKRLDYQANRAELIKTARAALENPRLKGAIKSNLRTELEKIRDLPEF